MGLFGPSIKKMEKKGDIEGLYQALKDERSRRRERAILALDRLAWKPQDDVEKAWYFSSKRAWQELAELGEPALPPLVMAILHHETSARKASGAALEQIALAYPDAALPLLTETLCGDLMAFTKKITEARNRTVELLGKMGDGRATLPLVQSYELLQKSCSEIPSDHQKSFRDTATDYYNVILRAIKEIGEPAIAPLSEALNSNEEKDSGEIRLASLMLSNLGPSAMDPLIKALDNDWWFVRSSAIYGLEKFEDTRATEHLAKALRDKYSEVRVSAAWALGSRSWQPTNAEEKAYFLLAEILDSNTFDGYFSTTKMDELTAMDIQAVDPLVRSLSLGGKVYVKRYKKAMPETAVIIVITLLSRIGKTAKPALEKALGDPDQAVQKAAQRALEGLK